jgi:NADH-quinone oxidoreductase subunit E
MSDNKIDHHLFIKENKPVAFSADTLGKIEQLTGRYPADQKKSVLLPVLHMAQEELGGYLTVDIMDYVAELIGIKPVEVYEVATFYSMFYFEKVGKYVLEVCRTGPCAICGGEKIAAYLQEKLRIRIGETTPDGLFTLKEVECLGGCGYAPVMQVNTEFHEHLTNEKIDAILGNLRAAAENEIPRETKWAEQFS